VRLLPLLLLTCAASAQELPRAARVLVFEAQPRVVKAGESVELRWKTRGAEKARLDPPGEEVPAQGQGVFKPEVNTVYWLSVGNERGGHSVPAVVEVLARVEAKAETKAETRAETRVEASPGGFWIQFAALADGGRAQALRDQLASLGDSVRLFPVAKSPGLTLQRIRMGPYPTREAAQRRLRELRPKAQALHLNPLVMAE